MRNIILLLILVALDQITKYLAVLFLSNGTVEVIKNFFYLRLVYNDGAAWSILEGQMTFFYIISVIAVIMVFYYMAKTKKNYHRILLVLVQAGIIGNFIDRLFLKYVRDFLDFYIFNYNYPVFNLADVFICIGAILLAIDIIRHPAEEEWQ